MMSLSSCLIVLGLEILVPIVQTSEAEELGVRDSSLGMSDMVGGKVNIEIGVNTFEEVRGGENVGRDVN